MQYTKPNVLSTYSAVRSIQHGTTDANKGNITNMDNASPVAARSTSGAYEADE